MIFDGYAGDCDLHGGGVNAFLTRDPAGPALDPAALKRLRTGRLRRFTACDEPGPDASVMHRLCNSASNAQHHAPSTALTDQEMP